MTDASLPATSLLAALALCPVLAACASSAPKRLPPEKLRKLTGGMEHAPQVELDRMMGDWLVFANIPYWAERGAHGSVERYRLDATGRIPTEFYFRKGSPSGPVKRIRSVARVADPESNAVWQVEFFGLINVPYIIAAVSPDYRWALIAHPSRALGWILARERLSDAEYRAILEIAKDRGYDPEKFEKVPEGEPFDPPPLPANPRAPSRNR